jgi:hypothetical protein
LLKVLELVTNIQLLRSKPLVEPKENQVNPEIISIEVPKNISENLSQPKHPKAEKIPQQSPREKFITFTISEGKDRRRIAYKPSTNYLDILTMLEI